MLFQNSILLEGRLTWDPELNVSKNGKKYCSFGICYAESKKVTDGEGRPIGYESIPNFFNCVTFGNGAEVVATMKKGDLVSLYGKICFSKYEKDGKTLTSVSIKADSVKKLIFQKKENKEANDAQQNKMPATMKKGSDIDASKSKKQQVLF